jgi:aspartate aminotransferase
MSRVSSRVRAADASMATLKDFFFASRYADRRSAPGISDFTFGNPHEMPLAGLVSAMQSHVTPHDKNWFAYKTSEEEPQAFLAEAVGRELALPFAPADIALTNGAFAAISVAFRLTLDAGDEAIYSEPAWFLYEPTLLAADAVPRKVDLKPETFDLDLAAIEAAVTPRTRLVIVNTPHNPTGRIYSKDALRDLADLLERASAKIGHRIFLLSDEPYRRIRFDGRGFVSPAAVYPWTLIAYSYGKILLAPGQRIGYLAISPLMPAEDRAAMQEAVVSAQMSLGWSFPNALMQYSVPELETIGIDIGALARRRDRLTAVLTGAGYEMLEPEGTFYLYGAWPKGDPARMLDALADRDVFVMPGTLMNRPKHFRISLTASDAMVDRALPAFAEILEHA